MDGWTLSAELKMNWTLYLRMALMIMIINKSNAGHGICPRPACCNVENYVTWQSRVVWYVMFPYEMYSTGHN
jgi:hypothetical protein